MPRIVTADDLRAKLGRELDALRESEEALYVSKRGRLAGVLLDPDRYAELIDRLDYLEDSLAALQARDEREEAVPWPEIRSREGWPRFRTRSAFTRRRLVPSGDSRTRCKVASPQRSTPSPTIRDRRERRSSRGGMTTESAWVITESSMQSTTTNTSC